VAKNGSSFPARLLKYDLSGNFLEMYDFAKMKIPALGVSTALGHLKGKRMGNN
jgi:hypothetical protein